MLGLEGPATGAAEVVIGMSTAVISFIDGEKVFCFSFLVLGSQYDTRYCLSSRPFVKKSMQPVIGCG
jgi:hypothetical protein